MVILADRSLPQCDHYRVVQKRMQLERMGWTVEIYAQSEVESCRLALNRACAVIFYRVVAFPAVLHAILYARALGIPTIYEIDDLLFDPALYPDPFESFEGQITSAEYIGLQYGVPLFRYAMRQCEVGLASTPALAQAMRPLVRSGICTCSATDWTSAMLRSSTGPHAFLPIHRDDLLRIWDEGPQSGFQ